MYTKVDFLIFRTNGQTYEHMDEPNNYNDQRHHPKASIWFNKCIFLKVIFHEKTYLNSNRTKVLLLLLLLLFLLLMCPPKHPLRKNTPNPE